MCNLDKKCWKTMNNRLRGNDCCKIGIVVVPNIDLQDIRERYPYGKIDVLCKTTREKAALRRRFLVRKAKSSKHQMKVLNRIRFRRRRKSSSRRNVSIVLITFDIPRSNLSRY